MRTASNIEYTTNIQTTNSKPNFFGKQDLKDFVLDRSNHVNNKSTIPAPIISMHFHDCLAELWCYFEEALMCKLLMDPSAGNSGPSTRIWKFSL